MSEDRIEGALKQGVGHLQDATGGLVGDDKTQIKGKLNEVAGSVQNSYGKIKDQAQDVVNQAQDRAQDVYEQAESFIKDQPLVAVGVSLTAGLVLGALLFGRRKTVYVRK